MLLLTFRLTSRSVKVFAFGQVLLDLIFWYLTLFFYYRKKVDIYPLHTCLRVFRTSFLPFFLPLCTRKRVLCTLLIFFSIDLLSIDLLSDHLFNGYQGRSNHFEGAVLISKMTLIKKKYNYNNLKYIYKKYNYILIKN